MSLNATTSPWCRWKVWLDVILLKTLFPFISHEFPSLVMSYDFRLTRPVGSHGLHCLGEKKAISLCPHSRVESCGIIDDVKNKDLNTPFTSSTAQGGGGSFKNRKPIGELGCCESRMAERSHWWTDRWLRSRLFLSLSVSFSDYLPTYPPIYLCIHLSLSLSVCLSIYLSN